MQNNVVTRDKNDQKRKSHVRDNTFFVNTVKYITKVYTQRVSFSFQEALRYVRSLL